MPDRQPIYQRLPLLGAWYRIADAFCIVLGLVVSIRQTTVSLDNPYVIAGAMAIILYGMLGEIGAMYQNWHGVSEHREAVGVLICWGLTVVALLILGVVTRHTEDFSRLAMFRWFAVTPALILAGRISTRVVQHLFRALGYGRHTFAVVGVNELGFRLAHNIEASPEMRLLFAGFFDDRPEERNPNIPDDLGRRIGTIQDLIDQAKAGRIDRIYITFPMRAEDRIRGVLERLGNTTASVYIVPDFFVFQLLHSRWTDILGLPVVSVFDTPFYGIDGLAKRLFDLTVGGLILLASAVPMALIAAIIRYTSPGPALFRQRRYGLDGREIRIWKFRTMTTCEDGAQAVQAKPGDARVTRFGAILRRTSLDELPQLFNVMAGSMSLVGPRPHATAQNEEFRTQIAGYMLRHKVKPGMTGLAQVNGWRGATEVPEKMQKRIEFDLRYIREWSLWLDIEILVRTVGVVLSQKNAY